MLELATDHVPATQVPQVLDVIDDHVPATQLAHVPAAAVAYEPELQALHVLVLEPTIVEYVPSGHVRQLVLTLAPTVVE